MNLKKVIVCDLDGTLTVSKSALSPAMGEVICHILTRHFFVVVSGGAFAQFDRQFLSKLKCSSDKLQNLSLFPTMGSTCYVYDKESHYWKRVYNDSLTSQEKNKIIKALNDTIKESGFDLPHKYGDLIEDRDSQITFSALGQNAPIDIKEKWDPNQSKRRFLLEILRKKIPEFEIHIGGTTSIDITKKGRDKAYAIGKIKELLHVSDEDIVFVGDALYKGGNDAPVKSTGVDFIQEEGPNETIELLSRYM